MEQMMQDLSTFEALLKIFKKIFKNRIPHKTIEENKSNIVNQKIHQKN